MSNRVVSVIVLTGLLAFSVVGYLAIQNYVERQVAIKDRSLSAGASKEFERFKDLPLVGPDDFATFKAEHSDGLPVDYYMRVRSWPALKTGYKMYLLKEGCTLVPRETCSKQTYVALNWGLKEAEFIQNIDDVAKVLAPIESKADALAYAEFITSLEYGKHFGIFFFSLTEVDDENYPMVEQTQFHLPSESWTRLLLPRPKIRQDENKFHIQRVGFIPYGEKQIILVNETVTSSGEYTYEIEKVLFQGAMVPITVKRDF
jgi:hypothetical protein